MNIDFTPHEMDQLLVWTQGMADLAVRLAPPDHPIRLSFSDLVSAREKLQRAYTASGGI